MSQTIPGIGLVLAAIGFALMFVGAISWQAGVAVIAFGFLFTGAWLYSPLPNHNGGFFAPPAKKQRWGFTSEPAHDDYKPLADYDYDPFLSANLIGINWAERETEDTDQ